MADKRCALPAGLKWEPDLSILSYEGEWLCTVERQGRGCVVVITIDDGERRPFPDLFKTVREAKDAAEGWAIKKGIGAMKRQNGKKTRDGKAR